MTIRKYVFIIDGEVGPDLQFDDSKSETNAALAAAMSSDPKVIEIPLDSPVTIGWRWNGTEFVQE
jgi:hypothetical protein